MLSGLMWLIEDAELNWHIIDLANFIGPVYTVAVTAVFNNYETNLNNKITLNYTKKEIQNEKNE